MRSYRDITGALILACISKYMGSYNLIKLLTCLQPPVSLSDYPCMCFAQLDVILVMLQCSQIPAITLVRTMLSEQIETMAKTTKRIPKLFK